MGHPCGLWAQELRRHIGHPGWLTLLLWLRLRLCWGLCCLWLLRTRARLACPSFHGKFMERWPFRRWGLWRWFKVARNREWILKTGPLRAKVRRGCRCGGLRCWRLFRWRAAGGRDGRRSTSFRVVLSVPILFLLVGVINTEKFINNMVCIGTGAGVGLRSKRCALYALYAENRVKHRGRSSKWRSCRRPYR